MTCHSAKSELKRRCPLSRPAHAVDEACDGRLGHARKNVRDPRWFETHHARRFGHFHANATGWNWPAQAARAVFLVRDVAANSDVYNFVNGACPELGLKLTTEIKPQKDHLVFQGRLTDLTGKDRAVTLMFAVPVGATGWRWATTSAARA